MAQPDSASSGQYLEKLPHLEHQSLDLTSPELRERCFYCGHNLHDQIDVDPKYLEADHQANEDTIAISIPCSTDVGGCGYRFEMEYPRQVAKNLWMVVPEVVWKMWFEREQAACEEKKLVPKWLKKFYEAK